MEPLEDGLDSCSQIPSIEDIDTTENVIGFEKLSESTGDDGCDSSEGCILGRTFGTVEEAFEFYNNYAKSKGFGIRLQYSNKRMNTHEIYNKRYVCDKEGFKNLNDKRNIGKNVNRHRDTRTGCQAMFQIKLSDGEWVVVKFSDIHNHPLIVTPSKVVKFKSHSKLHLSNACKSLVSELNQSGLTSSKISRVVNVMNKEINITPTQCSTILSTQRKNNVGQECYGIIKHFQERATLDESFYFAMELAADGTFRSVFWVDGRSRASYAQFGDVLVFDVTYRTNKFKLPFAPFVGVNHHGQTVLFGAALLEDETEATFIWLFEQFRQSMFDKTPVSIITDQDKAIGNAIYKVFPGVRHRFCAWHIKKHFLEHLQPLRSRCNDFNDDYIKWYKSQTIEEFDHKWQALKTKYDIEDNSWLAHMFTLRHHWANAYLKDTFFAGMTTSGRSESINSFFDGYVNCNTMLNEFVMQYDKAVNSRREKEEDEDFKTRNSRPVLESNHPIEAMAGELYTRKIFEIFKKEWKAASLDCIHETISKNECLIKYRVGSSKVDQQKWRIVDYQLGESFSATCSCAMFETWGLLCKHILYIMKKKHLTCLPEKYILHRWTINASYKLGNIGSGQKGSSNDIDETEVNGLVLWSVRAKFTKAVEDARDSPSEIKKIDTFLNEFLEYQVVRKKSRVERISEVCPNAIISQGKNIIGHIHLRDPIEPAKTKGRPKVASRIKSSVEVATNPKTKRTCSYCGGKGHYRTGCQKLKVDEAEGKLLNVAGRN